MEIWAHTMVKNEARWLWYSVVSIIDHVDKILVWDTGSTDGSQEIINELLKKYPRKIQFKQVKQKTIEEFSEIRQEMLEETFADWFVMLDGDEIWWEGTIRHLLSEIRYVGRNVESIVVPTINAVGDIFHYQDKSAGMYKFGDLKGHYNLRAIKRSIPGLKSQGVHGIWGWADGNNKMIQDRNTYKFVDAPYLHTTFLQRGEDRNADLEVVKRSKKIKYELGISFPRDFYYPEVFFKYRPKEIKSPWESASYKFKSLALLETPLKKIKRKLFTSKTGY